MLMNDVGKRSLGTFSDFDRFHLTTNRIFIFFLDITQYVSLTSRDAPPKNSFAQKE